MWFKSISEKEKILLIFTTTIHLKNLFSLVQIVTHICFNYTYFIKCVTLLLILDLTCVYFNICLIIKVDKLHFITLLPPRIHLFKKKISGIMFYLILVYTACSLYLHVQTESKNMLSDICQFAQHSQECFWFFPYISTSLLASFHPLQVRHIEGIPLFPLRESALLCFVVLCPCTD